MNQLSLNRKQLGQLVRIFEQFKDTDSFTLQSSSSSGIGPTVTVKFSLFGDEQDTTVDITDLSTW